MLTSHALATSPLAWGLDGDIPPPIDDGPSTIREAVHSRLTGSETLAAIVGARIHYARLPQSSGYPAVVISIPSRRYDHNLGGSDGTSTATVQIDCWASRPGLAEVASEAVRVALDGFRGSIGQIEILRCLYDDVGEMIEKSSTARDDWSYRHVIRITATHRVTKPPTS